MAPDDELGRENLSLIVGDAMVEMLSMDTVREMQFEDFLLNVNPTDFISTAEKQELANLVIQTATSGAPTKILKNYLVVKKSESYTEAENQIDAIIYKEEKAEADKLAQEREIAMAQSQLASDTQKDIVAEQTSTTMDKAAIDSQTKLGVASINASKQNNSKPPTKK